MARLKAYERMMSKVIVQPDGCWRYTGRLHVGYARLWGDHGKLILGHRLAYKTKRGKLRADVILDHTCHDPNTCPGGESCPHRACVNHDHVEKSTYKKNASGKRAVRNSSEAMRPAWEAAARKNRAKTHCVNGHPRTEDNAYWHRGYRKCLICHRAAALKRSRDPRYAKSRRQAIDRYRMKHAK